jgi:hypothetical protein
MSMNLSCFSTIPTIRAHRDDTKGQSRNKEKKISYARPSSSSWNEGLMNFNIDCDSNSRPLVWEHGGAHSFRLADTRRVLSMAPTVIWEFSTNRSRCPDIRRQNRSSLPRVASTVLNLQSHTPLESLPASLGPLSSRSCFLSRSLFIALVATASHYLRQFFRFQSPRVFRENGRFALRTPILRPDKHKELSDSRRPFVT